MKATHSGHCQICGCNQKLPSGHLSLHGYTTQWGFFSGTCNGSRHLPFEQSIDLIEVMILRATHDAIGLRTQANEERAKFDPNDCWVYAYFTSNERNGSGHRWIKSALSTDAYGRVSYAHPGDTRPARQAQAGYRGGGGLIVAAKSLQADYAKHLERQAAQRDEYVAWQRDRIANWAPSPLKLISK